MVAKFDTGGAGATQTKGGGGNTLLWIGVIVVASYLGWRYILKPYLDKQKAEANKEEVQEVKA